MLSSAAADQVQVISQFEELLVDLTSSKEHIKVATKFVIQHQHYGALLFQAVLDMMQQV